MKSSTNITIKTQFRETTFGNFVSEYSRWEFPTIEVSKKKMSYSPDAFVTR